MDQAPALIEFAKLSGSGNDFICIDGRDSRIKPLLADPSAAGRFAKAICRRSLGIGADGVIFACHNEVEGFADIAARHFEPDGSEAELCGNGVACFTRWAIENAFVAQDELKILTTAGVVRGKRMDDNYVRVCIPLPEAMQMGLSVEAAGKSWDCDFIVTGVPHLVCYVDDLESLDIGKLGPALRYHERFSPRGVNANFVKVLAPGKLAMRTWEFGVEGETLACGTGSAAAAIVAASRFGWPAEFFAGQSPVCVSARSGDVLRVYFEMPQRAKVTDLCIETLVRFICRGVLHDDLARTALGR